MKKAIIVSIILTAILLVAVAGYRNMPEILSFYLSRRFDKDVTIEKASLRSIDRLALEGITVGKDAVAICMIDSALIGYEISGLIRRATSIGFMLRGVEILDLDTGVIKTISDGLSIDPFKISRFDHVKGRFSRKGGISIIKGLEAHADFIRVFVDAVLTDDSKIDADCRFVIAEELLADVPEATRKVFFKSDGSDSNVELHLSGDMSRPSVSFSTDLFRLSVR